MQMEETEAVRAAAALLSRCEAVLLAGAAADGSPVLWWMEPMRTAPDGMRTLWFTTRAASHKALCFAQRPAAAVAYGAGGEHAALRGTVTVVTDAAQKEERWRGERFARCRAAEALPAGQRYCLLCFAVREGSFTSAAGETVRFAVSSSDSAQADAQTDTQE